MNRTHWLVACLALLAGALGALLAMEYLKDARPHPRRTIGEAVPAAGQRTAENPRDAWNAKPQPPYQVGVAVKTPKELDIESILDQELRGISPLKGISLSDAMETVIKPTVKALTGKDLNYQIDPNPPDLKISKPPADPAAAPDIIGDTTVNLPELRDTTIRNLLLGMLRPSKLNFIISGDRLFISTFAGCRREEATNGLSFRQYDVADLLRADLLSLIVQFTGAPNWDSIGVDPSSATAGMILPPVGEAGVTAEVVKDNPPGRMMYLRGRWLMVNQSHRTHKQIEDLLAELRAHG